MRYSNRKEAGRLLAHALEEYKGQDAVIYALPRGGVEVGVEIAKHISAPIDLVIPRKVGHPMYPEYAVCAVTESGDTVCNEAEIIGLDEQWLQETILAEQAEAKRRRELYLANRQPTKVEGKTAIVVDDGVATGLSAIAAIRDVQRRNPSKVVLAVPVIPREAAGLLMEYVDEIVALEVPDQFLGYIAAYYDDFGQVEDDEVIRLLDEGTKKEAEHGSSGRWSVT